jgi:CBS domain-containing protein
MQQATEAAWSGACPVAEALAGASPAAARVFVHDEHGWGSVSVERLRRMATAGEGSAPLTHAVEERLPHLFPDHPLEAALRLLHGRPSLPVAHRAGGGRLVGVVTLEDVLRAYRAGTPKA